MFRRLAGTLLTVALVAGVSLVSAPAAEAATFKVSVGVSAKETAVGGKVTFAGKVTGKTTKRSVQIQRKYAGSKKWSKVATVKTDGSGRYSWTTTMTDDRDRYYRVYKPAEKKIRKKYSASIKVVVYKASASTETLPFTSTTVTDGSVSMCAAPVVSRVGVPGSVTRMYRDGKLWRTERVEPIGEIITVGASSQPCASSVSPASGASAGGQQITITGHNLDGPVTFGGTAASATTVSGTKIVVEAPALDGGSHEVNVAGVTVATFLAVVPARVDSISPSSGSFSGGETVTITGAGLTGTEQVLFTPVVPEKYWFRTDAGDGSMPASKAKFTVVGDGELRVVVPPGISTQTTVQVVTGDTTATTTYTYALVWREPSEADLGFMEAMNDYRARGYNCDTGWFDLPAANPVVWDGYLADFAMSHSRDMIHRNPEYRELSLRNYGNSSRLSHSAPGFKDEAGYKARVPLAASKAWLENITGSGEYGNYPFTPKAPTARDGVLYFENLTRSWSHCMAMMEPLITKVGTGFDAANLDKVGLPSPYHVSKYVTVEMGPVPGAKP